MRAGRMAFEVMEAELLEHCLERRVQVPDFDDIDEWLSSNWSPNKVPIMFFRIDPEENWRKRAS